MPPSKTSLTRRKRSLNRPMTKRTRLPLKTRTRHPAKARTRQPAKTRSAQRVRKIRYVPAKLVHKRNTADIALRQQSSVLLHWSIFLFLILMSFFAAFSLFPFLLIANVVSASLFVVLFGLCYGYVFYLLIEHLEPVWYHHKFFAAVFIPAISLMSIVAIGTVAQTFSSILTLRSCTLSNTCKFIVSCCVCYTLYFIRHYSLCKERIVAAISLLCSRKIVFAFSCDTPVCATTVSISS